MTEATTTDTDTKDPKQNYLDQFAGFVTESGERLHEIGNIQVRNMERLHALTERVGKLEQSLLHIVADLAGITIEELTAQLEKDAESDNGQVIVTKAEE